MPQAQGPIDGRLQTVHTLGRWQGEAWMSVPLEFNGHRYELLSLGPRRDGQPYTVQEGELVAQVAAQVARAVHLASPASARAKSRRNGDEQHDHAAQAAEGTGGNSDP